MKLRYSAILLANLIAFSVFADNCGNEHNDNHGTPTVTITEADGKQWTVEVEVAPEKDDDDDYYDKFYDGNTEPVKFNIKSFNRLKPCELGDTE